MVVKCLYLDNFSNLISAPQIYEKRKMNSIKDLNVEELAILDESDKSDGDQYREQFQATVNSASDSEFEDEAAGKFIDIFLLTALRVASLANFGLEIYGS